MQTNYDRSWEISTTLMRLIVGAKLYILRQKYVNKWIASAFLSF